MRTLIAIRIVLFATLAQAVVTAQSGTPPVVLPPAATTALVRSLADASAHPKHVWRDTDPINADGTVNGYVEIAKGDRRKWEFDMRAAARVIDRVIPGNIGGYPVNYGFVPQTVSYDGDPFDVLVLGPPLPGGRLVRGVIVGVMFMEDEKGQDSKVVLSRTDARGRLLHTLTPQLRREIGDYFARYKEHQPGAFSTVPGWGSAADGLAYVTTTHAFFTQCRRHTNARCVIQK